jgi:hypothetical protein
MITMITQYPNWLQAAERLYWVHPPCQYGWPVTRKKNREMLQDLETPEAERIIKRREPQVCSTIQELNDKHDALHAAVFAARWRSCGRHGSHSIDVEREKKAAAMQKTIDEMKSAESEAAHAAKKMNWQSHGS